MIYFISDTHFYHEKIIEYVNRPFKDVEEMNNTLIDNWNKRVKHKDEVYILGDFSFGNKEQTLDLLDKLNGRKYLIQGNHDRVVKDKEVASKFEWIKDYHKLKYKKYKFILFHYPLMVWDCQHYGAIHLYGHIHSGVAPLGQARMFNMSVEKNNYEPVSIEEIIESRDKRMVGR